MVILLVANDINQALGAEVVVAQLGRAEVLGHVDTGAVAAQQHLLVEAVAGEVATDGAIGTPVQHTHIQTLLHQLFAEQVGVRFIVHLVEADTEAAVGFVETGIHPSVHLLPQGTHFLVALFPAFQHLLRLHHQGGLLLGLLLLYPTLHQLLDFCLVVLVELHVVFAHQVVALHAGAFGRLAVAEALPGQHALADVDAAVVHEVDFLNVGAVGGQQLAHRPA